MIHCWNITCIHWHGSCQAQKQCTLTKESHHPWTLSPDTEGYFFFFFNFYSWLGSINQGDQFHLVISGAAAIRLIRKQASYYNTHQSHFGVAWSVTCNQIAHFVSFGCHEKALWSGTFHTLKVSHLWDNLTVFEFNFRQQGNRFITILAPMMQAVNMGEVVNSVWSSVSPERIILLQWKQLPLHSNTLCHWFKV